MTDARSIHIAVPTFMIMVTKKSTKEKIITERIMMRKKIMTMKMIMMTVLKFGPCRHDDASFYNLSGSTD